MSTPYDFEADPPTPRQRAVRGTVQALVGMVVALLAMAGLDVEQDLLDGRIGRHVHREGARLVEQPRSGRRDAGSFGDGDAGRTQCFRTIRSGRHRCPHQEGECRCCGSSVLHDRLLPT